MLLSWLSPDELCIGPPYYCSVFKDQYNMSSPPCPALSVAAVTAIITRFVFKVKLYFLAVSFFCFQAPQLQGLLRSSRHYRSLRWIATLTCFRLSVKLKISSAIFFLYFQPSQLRDVFRSERYCRLLRVAILTCFPLRCQVENQLCDFLLCSTCLSKTNSTCMSRCSAAEAFSRFKNISRCDFHHYNLFNL